MSLQIIDNDVAVLMEAMEARGFIIDELTMRHLKIISDRLKKSDDSNG